MFIPDQSIAVRRSEVRPGCRIGRAFRIGRFLAFGLIAGFALALGSCGAGPAGGLETRTFRLEHIEPGEMASLIEPYILSERGLLQVGSSSTRALTIRERREILDRIAATVAEYDKPQPTVVLHFELIEADGFEESDPAIAEVESVLRELFRFKGYRLATETVVRGSTRSEFSQRLGSMPSATASAPLTLEGSIRELRGGAEDLSVNLSITVNDPWRTVLMTNLEIPVGHTVVLGSGQPSMTKSTLIVTVRPEIVE
jgi:hypothetical protein